MSRLMKEKGRVTSPGFIVGLDFGLCTPGQELGNIHVSFYDGKALWHIPNTFFDSLNKLVIRKREVAGAGRL